MIAQQLLILELRQHAPIYEVCGRVRTARASRDPTAPSALLPRSHSSPRRLARPRPAPQTAMREAGFEGYSLSLPPADMSIIPPELLPPADLFEDRAVRPGDFSTGSLTLNRMIRHASSLSFEQRRALIYGGDQLVP